MGEEGLMMCLVSLGEEKEIWTLSAMSEHSNVYKPGEGLSLSQIFHLLKLGFSSLQNQER